MSSAASRRHRASLRFARARAQAAAARSPRDAHALRLDEHGVAERRGFERLLRHAEAQPRRLQLHLCTCGACVGVEGRRGARCGAGRRRSSRTESARRVRGAHSARARASFDAKSPALGDDGGRLSRGLPTCSRQRPAPPGASSCTSSLTTGLT
eukprot:799263-Prymnesium_polylepis.1